MQSNIPRAVSPGLFQALLYRYVESKSDPEKRKSLLLYQRPGTKGIDKARFRELEEVQKLPEFERYLRDYRTTSFSAGTLSDIMDQMKRLSVEAYNLYQNRASWPPRPRDSGLVDSNGLRVDSMGLPKPASELALEADVYHIASMIPLPIQNSLLERVHELCGVKDSRSRQEHAREFHIQFCSDLLDFHQSLFDFHDVDGDDEILPYFVKDERERAKRGCKQKKQLEMLFRIRQSEDKERLIWINSTLTKNKLRRLQLMGEAKAKREELASKQVTMLSSVANNSASTMELLKDFRNQQQQKANDENKQATMEKLFRLLTSKDSYLDDYQNRAMLYVKSLSLNSPFLLEALVLPDGDDESTVTEEFQEFLDESLGLLTTYQGNLPSLMERTL